TSWTSTRWTSSTFVIAIARRDPGRHPGGRLRPAPDPRRLRRLPRDGGDRVTLQLSAIDAFLDEAEGEGRLPLSRIDERARELGLAEDEVEGLYEELDALGVEVWDDSGRPETGVAYA